VHRTVTSPAPSPVPSRGRRPLAAAAVAGLAVALGLGLVAMLLLSSFSLPNPFATTTVEHDDAVALTELRDLARFEAASAGFQTVVDREEDADYLPDVIKGERVTLVVGGDVDAYVDFAGLPDDAVVRSPDGRTVTVTLPEPVLDAPRLDHDQTRVVSRERGLLDRIDDAVTGGDPVDDQVVYQRAEEKLAEAATVSDLRDRARDNTRRFLTELVAGLGYEQVVVRFVPGDAAAG
jgi:hypothetical protein